MLPLLNSAPHIEDKTLYQRFAEDLKAHGFSGDIQSDEASRVTTAVDNSIYQVIPSLVLFPKSMEDIKRIFTLSHRAVFRNIKLSARGAGTGTNGQSLCSGVIIDASRHLNHIIEINEAERYAIVEPGVVLDQLNAKLKTKGLFFAPHLSPGDRATIGGMASTDACGKGSFIHGRTSEHLVSLVCVLSNGEEVEIKAFPIDGLSEKVHKSSAFLAEIYRTSYEAIVPNYDLIEQQFPKLSRFMTGFNLAKAYDRKKRILNLNALISGSEGTLACIAALKLKLTRLPQHVGVFAVFYPSFQNALKDARKLIALAPTAIETIDEHILKLAKEDAIYPEVRHILEPHENLPCAAMNLIEFTADNAEALKLQCTQVSTDLSQNRCAFYFAEDTEEIRALWALRKKGVGLLGAMQGTRKPVPFMEDTAVPPERLADYISELRSLLDQYGLSYGMFGHVDVGCLHVRPALDMNCEKDRRLVVQLSSQVNKLVKKYGGVYWSEHGKGFRSEFVKDYFGAKLYDAMRKIKGAFDPFNQLNPGKIVTPFQSTDNVVKLDGPFRGLADQKVPEITRKRYSGAFDCNGNAACLNYDVNTVMCPSAKATRNWNYSPKGRSALLREWLKKLSEHVYFSGQPPAKKRWQRKHKANPKDFSFALYQSLNLCLGCKACASACPIKVNIPEMKSRFLAEYHSRYRRSLRDYFIRESEKIAYLGAKFPRLSNKVMAFSVIRYLIKHVFKLVDLPKLSKLNVSFELKARGAPEFRLKTLKLALSQDKSLKNKAVCLVQDAFSSFYDAKVVLSTYDLLTHLGYTVYVLPFIENGKPAHVKGFLATFKVKAQKAALRYRQIAALGIPLVGIEPSITLTYRDEYPQVLQEKTGFKISLFQEWLAKQLPDLKLPEFNLSKRNCTLLAHCSERALSPSGMIDWQRIFKAFDCRLTIAKVGCCGMAGTFGHEYENLEISKVIYQQSWQKVTRQTQKETTLLADGFSCRCQVRRFENFAIQHPVEYLSKIIKNHLQ